MYYELFNPNGEQVKSYVPLKSKKDLVAHFESFKAKLSSAAGYFLDRRGRKISVDQLDHNCHAIGYRGKGNPFTNKRMSEILD